jgi:hypothetical protein
MPSLSSRLSRAVADGRQLRWRPGNREEVLARLLVKRAEAKQAGLAELEAALREQIAWALPVRRCEEKEAEPPLDA